MAKRKRYYAIGSIENKMGVGVGSGYKSEIDLTWADGMVGVMAVFTNKKKAVKYADGKSVFDLIEYKGELI